MGNDRYVAATGRTEAARIMAGRLLAALAIGAILGIIASIARNGWLG